MRAVQQDDRAILVVDDEATNLRLVSECLKELGCRILVARNGQSALEKARLGQPDLILLDVLMPGLDGFETCRRLKADEALRDIPVIFMSSLTETEDKVRGFQVGAVDYITKPFQQEEVLARLETHLRLPALTHQLQQSNERLESEIAERRLAQEALQEKAQQLRTLINAMPDIVIFKDGQGRYLEANDFGLHFFGLEDVDYRGKTDSELAAFTPFYHNALQVCKETDEAAWRVQSTSRSDEILPRPDGSSRVFDVIKVPTFHPDGCRKGLLVVGRDVTERKQAEEASREAHAELEQRVDERTAELRQANEQLAQRIQERKRAEEALRQSEERYRGLVEMSPDAVLVHDGQKLLFVNPTAARILGVEDPSQAVGMAVMDIVHPDWRQVVVARVRDMLQERKVAPLIEERFQRLDGSGVDVEVAAMPVMWQDAPAIQVAFRDITERKRAELVQAAIYRISEATQTTLSLDELFASIHATIAGLMPARNFYIALCEAATETIDFPYYADEFDTAPSPQKMGQGLTELVLRTGEPLLATPAAFEQLVQTGQVESLGAPSVDWLGVPLKTQRGETIGMMAVQTYAEEVRLGATDREILEFVSTQVAMAIERKRAEEEIKNAHRRLDSTLKFITTVISAIPIPLFYKDRESRYIGVNDAFAELLGFTPDYYAGKTVMELWPSEFAEVYHQKDLELMSNPQKQVYEFQVLDKNGVVHPAIWCKYVFRDEDGQVAGIVGAFQDITERKQAEEALRESEERYRTLYEDNPSMYFTVDPAGTVLSVNQFGCEQLGYTAQELVGQSVLDVFHAEDKDAAARSIALCVENLGQVFHWELRKVHKAGGVMWVKETARAMRGPDEQVVVLIVCEDTTERKRAEEEKEKLQDQMVQVQKMEALGQLAGGIAHDFGNLLAVIKLSTEVMKRQMLDEDPLAAHVDEIAATSDRASKLARQLLSFGRRDIIEPRLLNLNDVILDLTLMLRRIAGEEIELRTTLSESLWAVKADPSQMEQVIVNLVVNARDAMPQGGTLTVETNNVILDEAYAALHVEAQTGQHVRLTISDTGVGMSTEVKTRIFEPFFTTKGEGRGTGLGLSIVFGILKQNGGHIQVHSQVGQGTRFEIYLPMCHKTVSTIVN